MCIATRIDYSVDKADSRLQNCYQLCSNYNTERLASLGNIGAQLRAPISTPVHHSTIVLRGLRGALNLAAIMYWHITF